MAFGNGKSGTIVGIGKIGESLSNSIDDVYLVDGLKHNLLSMSQLCDKDNPVVLTSNRCLVVNMDTGNIVCYHCGKTGHVRYVCPSRDQAFKKNFNCVKQIWIRKDELSMLKGMGPKQIWVPKTNK